MDSSSRSFVSWIHLDNEYQADRCPPRQHHAVERKSREHDRLFFSYQLSNIPGRLRVDDAAQSLDLPMAGFLAFTDANTSVAFAFR
jgi:hypothetical protein